MRIILALSSLFAFSRAKCPFFSKDSAEEPEDKSTSTYYHEECSNSELKEIKLQGAADPWQRTVKGCECSSECGAALDFGNANCDWCYTKASCGHFSATRLAYYDYCVYPKNATYENQQWEAKQFYLWSRILNSPGTTNYPIPLGALKESVQTVFDDGWDWMPAGRTKYIHSAGATCKFNWAISPSSPYTGIFKPGTTQGLARFGSALTVNLATGLVPGIGIKVLRDNVQSANFVLLYQLDPQSGFNFFSNPVSNHIPPPGILSPTQTLVGKFQQASGCIPMVGLSDAAMYDQKGVKTSRLKFPYKLLFVPTGNVKTSSITVNGMISEFEAIPKDTAIYEIQAWDSPKAFNSGAKPQVIGMMYTASSCRTSTFGDQHLFFRHQRMEEDLALRPEWIKDMNPKKECGVNTISAKAPEGCPPPGSFADRLFAEEAR